MNTKIPPIVLASISPRRKMLLHQVGIPFTEVAPDFSEHHPTNGNFAEIVVYNSLSKALSVVDKAEGRLILGADTIVNIGGLALGKPKDRDEARTMLNMLSGKTHTVHSGIALVDPTTGRTLTEHVMTCVHFRVLANSEIDDYIDTGEPMDKAGAYGIQERGALFIERVEGCFFNVMGLSVSTLWEMLIKFKFES